MRRTTQHQPARVLVAGIGNRHRGDDAIGPLVAAVLRRRPISGCTIIEHSGEATALLEAWRSFDAVFLIDAVDAGAAPGTLLRLDGHRDRLPVASGCPSSHGWGVAEAVALGRALGTLPPRLTIFGIQAMRFTPGIRPSPPVRKAARRLIAMLRHALQTGLGDELEALPGNDKHLAAAGTVSPEEDRLHPVPDDE